MRYILVVLLVCGLLFVLACPNLKNSATEFNNNQNLLINQEITQRNSNLIIPSETPIPDLDFTPKEPLVWIGSILADNSTREIDKSFSLSNGTIDDDSKYSEIGMVTKVDIFNCAGYLMSGKAEKRSDFGWEFEMIPETVVFDAIEKMKQCADTPEKERKERNLLIGNYIFAVAPSDKAHKNFKSSILDATGIFAQLPRNIQKLLNDTKFGKDIVWRPIKSEISKENGDEFVDIDGDGQIDLVHVSTICSEDADPEGDGCSFLIMKINGKWKQVGYITKA